MRSSKARSVGASRTASLIRAAWRSTSGSGAHTTIPAWSGRRRAGQPVEVASRAAAPPSRRRERRAR